MFKQFSGSCLSLDEVDYTVRCVMEPHVLGPGFDFFTPEGNPVRPPPSAHIMQKVFSGSALDLNAFNGDALIDDDNAASLQSPSSPSGGVGATAMAASAVTGGGVMIPDALISPVSPKQRNPSSTVSSMLSQMVYESEKERLKAAKNKTQVLVVDGYGYLASHVVAKLLDAGYSVRITVSDALRNRQQTELLSMARDGGSRLSITEVDPTSASALKEVVRGCKYIFHCGLMGGTRREKDLVALHRTSVQALFDAIRHAGKPSVKRVILTGAATSVFHISDPTPPSGLYDESHRNEKATAKTDPMHFAKSTFENEAWRLKVMVGVELLVILPSYMLGPSLTVELSEGMHILSHIANSLPYFPFAPDLHYNFVDVRDVAEAHLQAVERSNVQEQRIIISKQCCSLSDIGRYIRITHPTLTPPLYTAPTLLTLLLGPLGRNVKFSFLWKHLGVRKLLDNTQSMAELGLQYTPMEVTIRDSIDQLISIGEIEVTGQSSNASSGSTRPLFITVMKVTILISAVGMASSLLLRWRKQRR